MFFLFIFLILLVFVIAIHTSKIGIEIKNLKIDTTKPQGEKLNKDNKIIIYVLIFNKLKLFKRDINKIDQKKIIIPRKIKIDYKEILQNINIDIKQIDLKVEIGTQDAGLTAVLTGLTSSVIGIILKKPKYEVLPVYSDKNFLKIKIDCIILGYLMQYIYKLIWREIFKKRIPNKNKEV